MCNHTWATLEDISGNVYSGCAKCKRPWIKEERLEQAKLYFETKARFFEGYYKECGVIK